MPEIRGIFVILKNRNLFWIFYLDEFRVTRPGLEPGLPNPKAGTPES